MVRATWAQATGSANWKPQVPGGSHRVDLCRERRLFRQDQVEREVETNLSLWYVFKQLLGQIGQLQLQYLVGWVKLPINI
jgi:hypothetical protein